METKIEWTATVLPDGTTLPGYTFNPWWGCIKVSSECSNCYAETFANRYGFKIWGPEKTTQRRFFGDKHWNQPVKWDYEAKKSGIRRKVFCASMADVFEDNDSIEEARLRLFNLIAFTPNLDWLLLTKRPENILKFIPKGMQVKPPANLWLGTSVGAKESMWRISELKKARNLAAVLFLSCEPLIEEINLLEDIREGIDWVIVGGESGPRKREFKPEWARFIKNDCEVAGVSFFMKQWDKIKEVPQDLMVRSFPI